MARSCQVLFFDNQKFLYKLSLLNAPLNTNGRASMLLLNKLAEEDSRVTTILFTTALMHPEYGNILMSHLEFRKEPSVTHTKLHHIKENSIHNFSDEEMTEFLNSYEPTYYGFFDKPEVEISRLKWSKISENIRIMATPSPKRISTRQPIDPKLTKAMSRVYKALVKMVENKPDQPRLIKT